MNHRISIFPYANLAPLRAMGCPDGYDFIYLDPKQTAEAFRSGSIAAAPVPAGSVNDLPENFEFIGAYGVSASGKVGSVLFYSGVPWEKLGKGDRVYLTDQSSTSVMLLFTLLSSRAGSDLPAVTLKREEADAELVIGDEALTFADRERYAHTYDLATLWDGLFGKPVVFARWAVRKDLPAEAKAALLEWLSRLDTQDAALVKESAPLEAARLGMSVSAMERYLLGMRRVLSREDLDGLDFILGKFAAAKDACVAWRQEASEGSSAYLHGRSRITHEECLTMLTTTPLGELMRRGHEERMRRHPGGLVTYVMDTNPNYTNVCTIECSFCAFHKKQGDEGTYLLSPEELAGHASDAVSKGATTILMQGGLNPEVRLSHIRDYIRAIRRECPALHIHPFSPSEIDYIAAMEKMPVEEVLQALWDEGVHTIPGGGAEILSERVRKRVSPKKITSDRWIAIMEKAHMIGFRTTATMMYGHVETPEDIAEHLFRLRDAQDRTGGYQSFIAWSFKPGNSPLGKEVPEQAHPAQYVRLIAVARLVLDNFDHVQSSWFSESENAGCLGLAAGADDFGGILVEENVLKTTGHDRSTTVDRVQNLIRRSGFTPARRDSDYRIREVFP